MKIKTNIDDIKYAMRLNLDYQVYDTDEPHLYADEVIGGIMVLEMVGDEDVRIYLDQFIDRITYEKEHLNPESSWDMDTIKLIDETLEKLNGLRG